MIKLIDILNESSLTISIASIVRELFPQEFFWVTDKNDKEKVKSVISDLVRTLNRFYKQQNIKVRFVDMDVKMKMYAREVNESLSSSEKAEMYKLMTQALKTMPNSQKQKEVIRQLNTLRVKGGMKPLKESISEWGRL